MCMFATEARPAGKKTNTQKNKPCHAFPVAMCSFIKIRYSLSGNPIAPDLLL